MKDCDHFRASRPWDDRGDGQLGDYRRKRDPARTPEPFGGDASSGAPLFVIQRHDARRLHYDLRLERDGALASWAVPRAFRSTRASGISRSTSRTIRSTTARSRA